MEAITNSFINLVNGTKGSHFWPQVHDFKNFVEDHNLGLLISDKKIFKIFLLNTV